MCAVGAYVHMYTCMWGYVHGGYVCPCMHALCEYVRMCVYMLTCVYMGGHAHVCMWRP